jgi:protein-disulfide isomerase
MTVCSHGIILPQYCRNEKAQELALKVRFGTMYDMATNNNDQGEITLEEEMKKEKKDLFLPISIIVAAILIGGAIIFSVFYRPGSAPSLGNGNAGANAGAAVAQTPTTTIASLMTLGPRDAVLGNQNAPVTIIEYGDYQCPFCARYFTQIQPLIKSQYIDTGKAKMVFRDFAFLGPESVAAANAAQCAEDQGKLWEYHDALYSAKVGDESKTTDAENDGFFTRAEFLALANQVGLNAQTFTSCLDGNQHADDVTAERTAATAAGIESTPATIVNGAMVVESDGSSAGADATAVLQAIANAANGK